MIERFSGEHGRRRVVDALKAQALCQHVPTAPELLESVASLCEFQAGETLIVQGAEDNDILFLLTGKVSIRIHGREVNTRAAGDHVGEMALIDVKAKRSASVVAVETTVIARVTEPDFTSLAGAHPVLWRYFALDQADRLRQRSALVRPKNSRPRIFVGSSSEALPTARNFATLLEAAGSSDVKLWAEDVFTAGQFTLEALELEARRCDFAFLLFTPDDSVRSRGEDSPAVRDNVVFEFGLFLGATGRTRTLVLMPDGPQKPMSDLKGLTFILYPADGDVASAAKKSLEIIRELGTL